ILFAPGLVLAASGKPIASQVGYIWLFVVGAIFMIRLLLDPMMVRRPLLEPNLAVGGMTFLGVSLLLFLMVNVAISSPIELVPGGPQGAQATPKPPPPEPNAEPDKSQESYRLGYPILWLLPSFYTQNSFGVPQQHDTTRFALHSNPRFIYASRAILIL